MARTRMLKPDLRTSEKVASWPIEIRYFWVLLWGYLDDFGKGKDNALLIKSDCFPLDPDITSEVVDEWLWVMAGDGVIVRYEVEGARFVAAVNWTEHQKPQHPTPSKIPDHKATEILVNDSGKALEPFTPGFSLVQLSEGQRAVTGAAPSPFCDKHPEGTTDRCKACGNRRRLRDDYDLAQKNKPTYTPPRSRDCTHKRMDRIYCLDCDYVEGR